MAVNFPDSPTNGDTTVINGATYTWDGVKWDTTSFASNVTATYDSPLNLPTTGLTNGDVAWVGGSTNKLYISNGTGWLSATLTNSAPVINSVQDASAGTTPFSLATDGTPTVITVDATDPESFGLTYTYSVTSGALGTTATVSQADNVFTITPGTNDPADAGTFELTFSVYDGVNTVTSVADFTLAFTVPVWYGERATFSGGDFPEKTIIDYLTIATGSNAISFGSLTEARYYSSSFSDGTYGYTAGGQEAYDTLGNFAVSSWNIIDRHTFATLGNATDFGDTSVDGIADSRGGFSDGSRGGYHIAQSRTGSTVTYSDVLEYHTLPVYSSATTLGTISSTRIGTSVTNDATRGLIIGGRVTDTNEIEYFTIQTAGNASAFGDVGTFSQVAHAAAASNDTYACFGAIATDTGKPTTIYQVTVQTLGNASTIGSITEARDNAGGASDGTYMVIGGGYTLANSGQSSAWLDRFTINVGSDCANIGSLTNARSGPAGASGAAS